MEKEIHNRKQRIATKRQTVIQSAVAVIEAIAEHRVDAYEGWQRVCGIFQANAGLGLLNSNPLCKSKELIPIRACQSPQNFAIPSGEMQYGS